MKRNNKKTVFALSLLIIIFLSIGYVIAAPSVNLSSSASGNTVNLAWTNNDAKGAYNYRILRSINGGEYNGLSATNTEKVKVLNVHPNTGTDITFQSSADGKTYTLSKAASLKKWMEEPNSLDANGFGRGLIIVDTITTATFNSNPSNYIKQVNGKYNYDVIMFGTWDANNQEDISVTAVNVVKNFIDAGGAAIFGHDTINQSYRNFARLVGYVGSYGADNTTQTTDYGTCKVQIIKDGVITKYPWNIGGSGTQLTVPQTHSWALYANGTIWMNFVGYPTSTKNFYLTTYNNCAVVQTGHSSCESTVDEQKILANLIFYLADIKVSTNGQDNGFIDIDKPSRPTLVKNILSGTTGTVTYSAIDNGTTYKYYIETTNNATQEKSASNIVTHVKTAGISGYSYIIDTEEESEPDNTIDTTNTNINYTVTGGEKTYLHIKAIDAEGNMGETLHILLHTNEPPKLELSKDITEWTNKDIIITASGTDIDGNVIKIRKPDGTVDNSDRTTYVIGQNGTYEFIATDNSLATVKNSITITNIDKIKPNGEYQIEKPTEEVKAASIHLTATDNASGVAKIILPNGTEVEDNKITYFVTTSGTYKFKIIDIAGNENEIEVPVLVASNGVEIRYIDQVTKEEIANRKTITGNAGDTYITKKEIIEGYELVKVPENAKGILEIDPILVTYEYRKQFQVTIKYIDTDTKQEIIHHKKLICKEGDEYKTLPQSIEGYKVFKIPNNQNGVVERKNIEVIYEYKKLRSGVIVKYIDQITNESIAENEILKGIENDTYETKAKEIEGYMLVKIPQNTIGKMTSDMIEVIYEYKRVSSGIIVKYIDQVTKENIAESDLIKGLEKDDYTTKGKEISGYKLVKVPQNATGEMTVGIIEVVYEYRKVSKVTIKYIDGVTKQEILESTELFLVEGDEYKTLPKDKEDYIATTPNKEGIVEKEDIEVIYEYKKSSDGLIVKYIDLLTNEIIQTKIYNGDENDIIDLEEIKYNEYELIESPDQTQVTLTKELQEVKYYYKKKIKLEVIYKDINTGEELDKEEKIGLENENYNTDEKRFDDYVLVEIPENKDGSYSRNKDKVIYGYKKKSAGVKVNYIDKETGKILEEKYLEGLENDKYHTEKMKFEKYNFIESTNNTIGRMKEELTEVNYYYEKKIGFIEIIYEDEEGNVLIKEEINGKVDEKYKVEKKEVEGYITKIEAENDEGNFGIKRVIIKYIMKKIPSEIGPETSDINIYAYLAIFGISIIVIIVVSIIIRKKNN